MHISYRLARNKEDWQNVEKVRTVRNTPKRWYNCAGYALETFNWYQPSKSQSFWNTSKVYTAAQTEYRTKKATQLMLEDFPDLRKIEKLSELAPDEYAIAFRISTDGDFHYAKRAHNGHWFHKMGGSSYIDTMTDRKIFSGNWCERYDGPLVLFAKKRAS